MVEMNRAVETNVLTIIPCSTPNDTTATAPQGAAKHALGRSHQVRSDNSRHLIAAVQRRREDTLERARRTLHELHETGQRHTVTEIAAHAGVSRSWLYAQPDLRDELRQLAAPLKTATLPPAQVDRASDASLRQRLALALERIREPNYENSQLRSQIAHLHGKLRANRIVNMCVADTVHDTNTLVTPPKWCNDLR